MTLQVKERPDGMETNGGFLDLGTSCRELQSLTTVERPATAGAGTGSSAPESPPVAYMPSEYERSPIESRSEFPRIPRLEGLDRHDPVLTSTVRDMLHKLWAIVVSRALQSQFPVERTVVSVFRDPEEDKTRALLRLFVKANAAQAIAFWDSLEKDFQDWLGGLDEHRRATFLRNISLRVYWS